MLSVQALSFGVRYLALLILLFLLPGLGGVPFVLLEALVLVLDFVGL